MKCPNCSVSLSKYSKYCPRCGILFESDDVKKYSEVFNSDFMAIYFPSKRILFHIDRISLGYFLLTYFYAIYKKMYKIAIISFISQYLLIKVCLYFAGLPPLGMGAALIPLSFLVATVFTIYFYYAFNFDRLLIEDRQIRVNKILRENSDKDEKDIVCIMEKDSKNNLVGALITFLVIVIIIIIRLVFL